MVTPCRSTCFAALLLLLAAFDVEFGEGADAVTSVTESSLNNTIASAGHVVLAFVANWCGRCRQLEPNLKWTAEKFLEEGITNVKVLKLDFSDLADDQSEALKSRYGVSELPSILWVTPREHSHFQGSQTANGIHQWARSRLAAVDIGDGLAACDACRASLEAMHYDWGALVRRLVEAGSVVTGQTPRLSDGGSEHLEAILGICQSQAMRAMSSEVQAECRKQLRWHGPELVGRHFGLFASWCGRSGDGGRHLSVKELQDCAQQWSSKVPNGRLGLHEKIMGMCGRDEVGGIVRVCEFKASGWKEAMRGGAERRVTRCEACRAVARDLAFALRTSKLAALPGPALAKRRLEVEELVEGVCVAALNRQEGDATEGPAKRISALCADTLDDHADAILATLLASVGPQGALALDVGALEQAVCEEAARVC